MADCDAIYAECRCSRSERHDGPHFCACLGSWDDNGTIHAYPGGLNEDEAAAKSAAILTAMLTPYEDRLA
jgi:hypothetical protein